MPNKPIVPAGVRWDEGTDMNMGIGSSRKTSAKGLDYFKKK